AGDVAGVDCKSGSGCWPEGQAAVPGQIIWRCQLGAVVGRLIQAGAGIRQQRLLWVSGPAVSPDLRVSSSVGGPVGECGIPGVCPGEATGALRELCLCVLSSGAARPASGA